MSNNNQTIIESNNDNLQQDDEPYNLEYCPGCDSGTGAIWPHLCINQFGEQVYHPLCYFASNQKSLI